MAISKPFCRNLAIMCTSPYQVCIASPACSSGGPWGPITDQLPPDHLQSYMEEFTYRFNRCTSRSRELVFRCLLEQAIAIGPITNAGVAHGHHWRLHNIKPQVALTARHFCVFTCKGRNRL